MKKIINIIITLLFSGTLYAQENTIYSGVKFGEPVAVWYRVMPKEINKVGPYNYRFIPMNYRGILYGVEISGPLTPSFNDTAINSLSNIVKILEEKYGPADHTSLLPEKENVNEYLQPYKEWYIGVKKISCGIIKPTNGKYCSIFYIEHTDPKGLHKTELENAEKARAKEVSKF